MFSNNFPPASKRFFTFYLTFLCCFSIDHFGGGKENFATIWECSRGGTPIIVSVWRWGFGKIKILNVSQIFFVFFYSQQVFFTFSCFDCCTCVIKLFHFNAPRFYCLSIVLLICVLCRVSKSPFFPERFSVQIFSAYD